MDTMQVTCSYSGLGASSSERQPAENNNELFDAIDELQNTSDDGSQNDDLSVNVSDLNSSKEILSMVDLPENLANQDIIMNDPNDTSLNDFDIASLVREVIEKNANDFDIDTFVSEVIENNANQNVIHEQFPQQQVDLNTDDNIPIYTLPVNLATQDMTQIFQNQQFLNDPNTGFLRDTPPPSPEVIFRRNILPENVPQIQNPPISKASEDKRKIGEIGRKIHKIKDKKVNICPIPDCIRTFNKNNKSRDLSDHVLTHFTKELARDGVKNKKPYLCPLSSEGVAGCDQDKIYKNFQDLKRHYGGSGSVHGKLLPYLDDKLANEHRLKAEMVDNKIVISNI